jgi:hypothetical protein
MKLKTTYRPHRGVLGVVAFAFVLTLAAVLSYGGPAIAANGLPNFTLELPAGLACSFDLQIEGWDGKQHVKEFTGKNGVVRTLSAGTGSALRYTNLETGATFSSKSNGAVTQTTYNLDGSSTLKLTGHNLVILFPTDFPPGPSTTLYAGHVAILIDTSGNWTVQAESGKVTDICAILSD